MGKCLLIFWKVFISFLFSCWTVAASRVLLCAHFFHFIWATEMTLHSMHVIMRFFFSLLKIKRIRIKWSELEWMKKKYETFTKGIIKSHQRWHHTLNLCNAIQYATACDVYIRLHLLLTFIVIYCSIKSILKFSFGYIHTYIHRKKEEAVRITIKQEGKNQAQNVYPWHGMVWHSMARCDIIRCKPLQSICLCISKSIPPTKKKIALQASNIKCNQLIWNGCNIRQQCILNWCSTSFTIFPIKYEVQVPL